MSKIDSRKKRLFRRAWKSAQTLYSLSAKKSYRISVWYGGARSGNVGGPLVKVKRLKQHFPEKRVCFSIVYLLSNTPYLTKLALKILRGKDIPIVLNQNGVYYPGWYDGDWQKKNAEMSIAWQNADHVFCQSEFCLNCANHFLGKRQGPTEVLFNAVDLRHFCPVSDTKQHRMPTFLLTGKFDSHMFYRIEASLKGFKVAKDAGMNAKIRIAGWMSKDCTSQYHELIEQLSIEEDVDLVGKYTQEQAPKIYQSADVYMMLKHNDPCPNTVLEALACGLPVLFSNSGGVPELATGITGHPLAVPQGFDKSYVPSPESIAEGMTQILSDLPIRKSAARARAEEAFDITNWIARHRDVFDKLLSEHS